MFKKVEPEDVLANADEEMKSSETVVFHGGKSTLGKSAHQHNRDHDMMQEEDQEEDMSQSNMKP